MLAAIKLVIGMLLYKPISLDSDTTKSFTKILPPNPYLRINDGISLLMLVMGNIKKGKWENGKMGKWEFLLGSQH